MDYSALGNALEDVEVGDDGEAGLIAVDPVRHGLDGSEIQAAAKSFVG